MDYRNHKQMTLLTGLFILFLLVTSAGAATLTVGPTAGPGIDHTTIQAAINAATAGDTILVQSGTYYENVNVNKRLTLQGNDTGGGMPVVDAGGSGNAIWLRAHGCTLQGFVAKNSSVGGVGIMVYSSKRISNNLQRSNLP